MTDAEIVAWAEKNDRLAEMCSFVDYDPNIGRVPEHWVPYWYIRDLVEFALAHPSTPENSNPLREALAELVACKDLKERVAAMHEAPFHDVRRGDAFVALRDEYERRQPLAWEAARRLALSGSGHPVDSPKSVREDLAVPDDEGREIRMATAAELAMEALVIAGEALSAYADPSFYHARSLGFDRPTGGFDEDFTFDEDYDRAMPGKMAREAMDAIQKLYDNAGDRHGAAISQPKSTAESQNTQSGAPPDKGAGS